MNQNEEDLNISIEQIQTIINSFRIERRTFTTIEVIREFSGEYRVDQGVPVSLSHNAAFGRFLSEHEAELGIQLVEHGVHQKDDNGIDTTTAKWRILES